MAASSKYALSSSDRAALRGFESAIRKLRAAIDPNASTQVIHAFLAVAQDEGQSLTEYANLLGTNISTASRQFLDLGDRNRKGEKGYMLVDRRVVSDNLRVNRYFLTSKGRLLLTSLLETLGGA